MYRHALLLGCTGMLRAASLAIANNASLVTSVARTKRSLAAIDAELHRFDGEHVMLALDWSHPDEYLGTITEHLRRVGLPDLVVAWIHDDRLALRLVTELETTGSECDFFHMVGSARDDPVRVAAQVRKDAGHLRSVRYRQVILGARREAAGRRWLTDAEISDGVLEAVARRAPTFVVGDPATLE